jgi:RNA polymerase sigma-70 factor, ECF subfamily
MDKDQIQQIITKCKTGDKQAFKALMLNLSEYVFRLAFRILNHEEDAKDIVQETFIRVWKHIDGYKEEIKITTWIYKIATNLCLDKLRINRRINMISKIESEKVFNRLSSENLSESIENKQLADLIKPLSENLTPKQKIVFVLKDLEGMETNEIEEITGMDNVQINSNLHLARQQIRKQLIQMAHEER